MTAELLAELDTAKLDTFGCYPPEEDERRPAYFRPRPQAREGSMWYEPYETRRVWMRMRCGRVREGHAA